MILDNNAPETVRAKAKKLLEKLNRHEVKPKKLSINKCLMLRVNMSWRLLSKDNGNKWYLLIYHEYNRHLKPE